MRDINYNPIKAFTLIELSIVLVIIGLIVGGVLVGRDLIKAAEIRAQISQIERYQQAVNTFRSKYNNYLPGDMPDPDASNFGFISRGLYAGEGDGNGVIEGNWDNTSGGNNGVSQIAGETVSFWVDLSKAHLLDVEFINARENSKSYWYGDIGFPLGCCGPNNGRDLLPSAKIGLGNYLYVWSINGINYFGLSKVLGVAFNGGGLYSTPNLKVSEASSIDRKIDDGLPQSGNVSAIYINVYVSWPSNILNYGAPYMSATPGSSTSCYDNNNIGGATQQYSVTQNNGAGINCALSFQLK